MSGQQLSRRGIGGSEAATALGLNQYERPIDLWQRKRAELRGERAPDRDSDAMRWGRYLEQPIRQAYADRFRVEVATPGESMFHRVHEWRRATPDGIVIDPSDGAWQYGLEVKTASHRLAHRWGDDGTDDVPQHYLIQCAWYMHVLDLPRWDLAVLIGGSDFRCYTIARDLDLEQSMVEQVDRFWHNNVLEGVEPADDASDAFTEYLSNRWPTVDPVFKVASPDDEQLVGRIAYHRGQVRGAAEQLKRLENELRRVIGEAAGLEFTGGRITCRPRQGRLRTDWESIARACASAARMPLSDLAALIEQHSKRDRGSRPLLYPRGWSMTPSDDDDKGAE